MGWKTRTPVTIDHIDVDENGVPRLCGSRDRVEHIAIQHLSWNQTPKEIAEVVYPHLSLGQVHAALAYYFDHREEIDARVEESDKHVELLRLAADEPTIRKRLREQARAELGTTEGAP